MKWVGRLTQRIRVVPRGLTPLGSDLEIGPSFVQPCGACETFCTPDRPLQPTVLRRSVRFRQGSAESTSQSGTPYNGLGNSATSCEKGPCCGVCILSLSGILLGSRLQRVPKQCLPSRFSGVFWDSSTSITHSRPGIPQSVATRSSYSRL